MELNHPLWSTADYHQHHLDLQDRTRFFKCSFCKRGFSNAQALGGHMNIHRRDRAKLRQLSCNNDKDDGAEENIMLKYHHIRRLKRSGNRGRDGHQVQQLPLLIEASQWMECDEMMHHSGGHQGEHYDGEQDLFPGLDLELRLGPEPDHRMTACLGTRKYF